MLWSLKLNCGSELARDSGVSATEMLKVSQSARASPLLQGGQCRSQMLWSLKINCGSGLARESGVSGAVDIECAYAFASKPAPTVLIGYIRGI
ncbi:hypothetical protein AM274_00240 [Pseudomonas nunensis]|nr:hypothetical protein AM274_00240 [Pseudomonas nunensis]